MGPMNVTVNGKNYTVPRRQHLTVHELLKALEVQTENQSLKVTINGDEMPRAKWLKEGASPGDEIEIVYD